MIKFIYFDVANTLLYKPLLFSQMISVFKRHDITVDENQLQNNHKLLSEAVLFPPKTSESFYRQFNADLLYSLGILPTSILLNDIFTACTYLSWAVFEDIVCIENIFLPKGIVSNWDHSLQKKLNEHVKVQFDIILGSADVGVSKPDIKLFRKAVELTGLRSEEILFVGDSLKLDIQPALQCGMQALLIDRNRLFLNYKDRISFMGELLEVINI